MQTFVSTSTKEPSMFPDRLSQGYRAFIDGRFTGERSRYETLAQTGQRPEIMIIGCVDFRVSPEVIFNAAPGELLVARNVANLVPRYEPDGDQQHGTSAALEFGVQALGIKRLWCLATLPAAASAPSPTSRRPCRRAISSAAGCRRSPRAATLGPRQDGDAYLRRLEFASVELSLKNLTTFPWVQTLVEGGKLALHGAYFGIATGQLLIRDPLTGAFGSAGDDLPDRIPMIR
jgi:carbonic anhydrase